MNGDKRTVLYRVAQEALTNVARHAQASEAEVRYPETGWRHSHENKRQRQRLFAGTRLHAKKSKRLGLLGMRERLEMVGGNFTIKSAPGKGTTVQAQIPLINAHARAAENAPLSIR